MKNSKYENSFTMADLYLRCTIFRVLGSEEKFAVFFRVKEDISKHTVWKVIVNISTKILESESSTIKVWLTELLQNKDAFPLREALADVFQTDKELHTCRYISLPVFVGNLVIGQWVWSTFRLRLYNPLTFSVPFYIKLFLQNKLFRMSWH